MHNTPKIVQFWRKENTTVALMGSKDKKEK